MQIFFRIFVLLVHVIVDDSSCFGISTETIQNFFCRIFSFLNYGCLEIHAYNKFIFVFSVLQRKMAQEVDIPFLSPFYDMMDHLMEDSMDHPPTQTCDDMECMICSVRDCPQNDPMHYHHDGCPSCEASRQNDVSIEPDRLGTTPLDIETGMFCRWQRVQLIHDSPPFASLSDFSYLRERGPAKIVDVYGGMPSHKSEERECNSMKKKDAKNIKNVKYKLKSRAKKQYR